MNNWLNNISVDLVEKYNVSGPYYTSYPALSKWSDEFLDHDYRSAMGDLCTENRDMPLFLYVHFPFCAKQCYFCSCNSIVVSDYALKHKLLTYIHREISLLFDFFKKHSFIPKLRRIHLGGGTPNLMNEEEFNYLIEGIKSLVNLKDLDEFTIEVDPRTTSKEKLQYYFEKGINRISLGIQDFDPYVQKAINRIQPSELIEQLLTPEIRKYFKSINFDLLYGLPLQNRRTFEKTLEIVKRLSPDRITLLKYAHMPERKKHQRLINEQDLPNYIEGTMIFVEAVNSFLNDGYEYIGIDHFAKSTDTLTKALKDKTLWRNFLGFTPGGIHNIIGIGPTSTGSLNNYYFQNIYSFSEYCSAIEANNFPIFRGYKLTTDDMIRREVINSILCNCFLDFCDIEQKYGIKFKKYFRDEINSLDNFVHDNILIFSNGSFRVTSLGRIFIRHICKVFDKYLKSDKIYKISGP